MASNGLMRNIILIILVFFIFLPIKAIAPIGRILVDEQGKERTLTVGENWEMKEGFILTIDTMEKSAKITLSKDGIILATEEILIDDNMYYEGNIDSIDYVFQTTLREVKRNSAVLADTELYAPKDVDEGSGVAINTPTLVGDTELYPPNGVVAEQPNYLTIIVSILVILVFIFILYRKRKALSEENRKKKTDNWKKEGYDLSELKK